MSLQTQDRTMVEIMVEETMVVEEETSKLATSRG